MTQQEIIQQFVELSVQRKQIPSLIRFSNWTGLDISLLRSFFANTDELQSAIWEELFVRTYNALQEDEDYPHYAAYEKLLSFHFTFVQVANDYREFLAMKLAKMGPIKWESKDMRKLKQIFLQFVKEVSEEGKTTGEIPTRMFVGDYINRLTWFQLLYVLHFWARDTSEMYGQTDAAVEKSTQWVFEILGRNVVDTSLDFGKFFFQNFSIKSWIKWPR